jgi:uncharacterized membrane protein
MPLDGEMDTSTEVMVTFDSFTPVPPLARGRSSRRPQDLLRAAFQPKHWAFIALVALYVVWFDYLSMKEYYGYGYPPFDLAIFDQGMWLLTHFHIPFVTVMGRNLFGDHTSFVLLLFAPFYRLFPEPQGLLFLQTFLLASPALPIYLLARKYIKSTVIATSLVATYLLSPLLQQGNLNQFHPEAFQPLFISVAIYAAIERKNRLLVVMVVLSLLVKEDAAMLVIPLGIWVAARRDRRLGISIVAGSVAYAALAIFVIIPSILGSNSIYSSRIPFGGVSGLLSTIFHRPGQFISYLGSQGRPFYLWQIAATVGFAFLFSPEIALVGILVAIENIVSNDVYMHQILYQYSIELAAVLALGALYAIAHQSRVWRRNAITIVALVGAIWTCTLWGLAPFSDNTAVSEWAPNSAAVRSFATLESQIPANAIVSAWYLFVPHLDHRTQIYLWPTPFDTGNYGLFNNNGTVLPIASKVEYLVLPVPLTTSPDVSVLAGIKKDFKLVTTDNGIGLYKRVKT